jgi:SNF2 family DNA or RNA helicase
METHIMGWMLKGPAPYAVQLEAMEQVKGHNKFGFWLEQGLGKTALLLNHYMVNISKHTSTIILFCPNSFKSDWAIAPSQWGLDFSVSLWPKDSIQFGKPDKPNLNILNYEVLRSGGFETVKDMMERRPCFLVFDESSAIKNFQAKITKGALNLCKYTDYICQLNGTPLTKDVLDLFSQLKVLGQFNGVNPYAFRGRYAVMGGYLGKKVVGTRPENEAELLEIQKTCTFRATKDIWWKDAPEKLQVPLRLEMTDKQLRHYRDMYEDFMTLVADDEYDAPTVLAQMDKLRQITSGIILDGERVQLLVEPKKNPKILAALDLIDNGTGKMIIVYQYKASGAAIVEVMQQRGLNPAHLRGGMKTEEVVDEKKKFNEDPDCRVLVGQYTATRMGHTLLGGDGDDRCHRMFFHDHTFSLLDRAQIEDRIHRGKQDKGCLYYNPVMSPIDEVQLEALVEKASLADRIVNAVRARKGKL